MIKWLKTLFFVLVLSVNVFSGTPFLNSSMNERVCPMKCCKKKAKASDPKRSDAKYLCRVLVCAQNVPTTQSTSANVNLAPVYIASDTSGIFRVLFSTRPKGQSHPAASIEPRLRTFQPKYIQNNSFLI